MTAFTKRSKHRRPVAFLLNKASLASFVLYFYKKVKTKEACGVPFKQSFTGLLCFNLFERRRRS